MDEQKPICKPKLNQKSQKLHQKNHAIVKGLVTVSNFRNRIIWFGFDYRLKPNRIKLLQINLF